MENEAPIKEVDLTDTDTREDLVSAFRAYLEMNDFQRSPEERHQLEDTEIARVLNNLILAPLFRPMESSGTLLGSFSVFIPYVSLFVSLVIMIILIVKK